MLFSLKRNHDLNNIILHDCCGYTIQEIKSVVGWEHRSNISGSLIQSDIVNDEYTIVEFN